MQDRLPSLNGRQGANSANGERPETNASGYLGLEQMTHAVDWRLVRDLDGDASRVAVAPRSPARKAGIRSGDYVVSINGSTFEAFNANPPPVGAVALVKVFRAGTGFLLFDATLTDKPLPKPAQRSRAFASTSCGQPVARNDRFKWLSRTTGDPRLSPRDKALAARLVVYYLNRGGEAFPAHNTIATELGASVSSVKRSIENLRRAGLLHVVSGRIQGRSNRYSLCWPAEHASNVVPIHRENRSLVAYR
jgi:membrane-associated protease RseP (regulator of RpoE activity)